MDILIKNIGNLSKECNECLRTYIAMNDGDENLIGSLRVDCKEGSADCPLVALPEHGDLKDEMDIIHRIEKIADADLAQDIIGEILASPTIVEAST